LLQREKDAALSEKFFKHNTIIRINSGYKIRIKIFQFLQWRKILGKNYDINSSYNK
jgi:hypothetical protein